MRETVLTIEGMTCAACAARVEKKLNGLQGVSAAVNYATATARVTAPAGLPARELVTAVERAGYAAREPAGGQPGDEGAADERDGARQAADLKRRLIVALVFFVPLTDEAGGYRISTSG
jgi:Cu+-exporting ATPase